MGPAIMSLSIRIASFLATATIMTVALTAAPTIAADATLGRAPLSGAKASAEGWALRSSPVPPATTPAGRPEKTIALSDLPEERRKVRIVYQGYSPSVSPAR